MLWSLVAAALFGASSPAAKVLLEGVGPFRLAGMLYLGAALAALPFAFRGGSSVARRRPQNLARLSGAVVFGGVIAPVLLMLALQRSPAANVSLWLSLEPPATALLAWALFREHLERRTVAAVVLVTVASALLAGAGASLVPAVLLVLGAAVCWGLDNNLSSLIDGFTPAQSTLVKGLVAGSVNVVLGLVVEPTTVTLPRMGAALAVGALCYGASIVLYVSAAQQLGAVRAQMFFASAPFFGVALSWLALREPVSWTQGAAAALLVGALAVTYRERHGHAHRHEATTHTHRHRHDDDHHGHTHDPPVRGWHVHEHEHEPATHTHPHRPDLHHRHPH